MARIQLPNSDSMYNHMFYGNKLNSDGYRMPVSVQYPTFTVDWVSTIVAPTGLITLSVDGDPGLNNVKDLASGGAGSRCWMVMGKPEYIDINFSGIPAAAQFRLIVR